MSDVRSGDDDDPGQRRRLVAAAAELVPTLERCAAEGERLRRLPDETVTVLRDAGMFRLAVPPAYGGHGAGMRTIVEVTAELARGDAAAAWVAMVMTGGAYAAGLLDDQGRDEIWGSVPDAAIATSLTPAGTARPTGDGGLVISGRWAWASGADAADWAALSVPVLDGQAGPPEVAVVLVPADQLAVEDTWHVAGMAGTGSKTFVCEEVQVPPSRVLSLGGIFSGAYADRHPEERFLRTPLSALSALPLVGPMIGMTRAALDATLETSGRKPMSLSFYERLADSPSTQLALADAASLLDTALLHAHRAADDVDHSLREGRALTELERTRVRMDTGVAATRCREAVELLLSVTGAGAFASANLLQKIWRDLGTASRHAACNPNLARELYGRALVGADEQPSFLV
ncbi:acyl-CoA dehydrogenase family protein [Streptacidiphilus griseoplanus]|uniref:acyl-CoA dehydrogenase family protein n=1 Tax=Peterkaempfera griseoplana TaxID=66896 RepID=UPI0006E12CDE|nr:acyl-CoA dehydrogenase family protein [Peterkaempfera griseoplana]